MTAGTQLCTLRELYVLDGLTPGERAEFEQHLAECTECQSEVRELQQVTEFMLYNFVEADPPPGMRERILGNVFADVQDNRVTTADAARIPSELPWNTPAAVAPPVVQVDPVTPWSTEGRSRRKRRNSLWPVAAAVVTAASLAWAISLQMTRPAETSPGPAPAPVQTPVGSVLLTTSLSAQSVMTSAKAQVYVSQAGSTKNMVLKFSGLAPAKGSQVYQIWLVRPAKGGLQVYSAGVFLPDKQGRALFAFQLPKSHYSIVAVTLEPKSIDKAPLGPKVLVGAVSV